MENAVTEGKQKILIVEDNPDIRLYLEVILTKAGFEVLQAANGAKAMDIAWNCIPDLIITDAMMPVLDGFGMIQALKREATFSRIPIIMMTGSSDSMPSEGAGQPEEYIRKPFTAGDILARIEKLLPKA